MDIKSRKFSHSLVTKFIVFMIVVFSFSSTITIFLTAFLQHENVNFDILKEDSYYHSDEYITEVNEILSDLTEIISRYKSEENILNGGAISENEIKREEEILFLDFRNNSGLYNEHMSEDENKKKFREFYAEPISEIREKLINENLKDYKLTLRALNDFKGVIYYIRDGKNVITNSSNTGKNFESFPSYIIVTKSREKIYPKEIEGNTSYNLITSNVIQLEQKEVTMYLGFTEEFLNPRIEQWRESKEHMNNSFYQIIGLLFGLILSFIYLLVIVGRRSFKDKNVYLTFVDRLYNDIAFIIAGALIAVWFGMMNVILFENEIYEAIFPITFLIAIFGLMVVLSIVKHLKNRTIIKHTLFYTILQRLFSFAKEAYDSGSVGAKVLVVVIAYPLIVSLTFYIFPITIGIGVWIALKKIKEYNTLKEGVEKVKAGDIHHKIYLATDGEFGKLAADINSITTGLNKAVDDQLKSERLKTELITNVSHDIRTPLTSIITYVDLLKTEKDPDKVNEYIEILDQKSQRLKLLTEDLFEASKASSGNIPVNFEKIDIASLITQGLGEMDDHINKLNLDFKVNDLEDKVYIKADGKLLWRAIENLLSNIYKYALQGSRVYIDIDDLGSEVMLTIKNISAYELNITSEELMERFKRGDESRSSEGSGLGLSIAKSLIEIQKGSFKIDIDGDLFKAIIKIPKYT